MLFSNPDYPLFLLAVFFLYALSRRADGAGWAARAAIMLLLGDVAFALIAKDPHALWDPLGGSLLDLASERGLSIDGATIARWLAGSAVIAIGIACGRTRGEWMASDRGQAWIARGIVIGGDVGMPCAARHRS